MISDFPLPLHFPGSVPGSDHMLTLEFQSSPRDIPGETIFEFHFRCPGFFSRSIDFSAFELHNDEGVLQAVARQQPPDQAPAQHALHQPQVEQILR